MTTPLEEYRNWSAEAQQRALRMLQQADMGDYRPFYCPRPGCDGLPHDAWEWSHARADQHPPKGDWFVWLLNGGRGCLAGESMVRLGDGSQERIDVLAARGEAIEVMTLMGPRWTDGAPFIKGIEPLIELRAEDGPAVSGTAAHLVLTRRGWTRLDRVRVGDQLACEQPARPARGAANPLAPPSRAAAPTALLTRQPPADCLCDRIRWSRVGSISSLPAAAYYDLTVDDPDERAHNYLANGIHHHNSGKTKSGSEYSHRVAKRVPYLGLIAPTTSGVRDVMVEGESGILATSAPGQMPQWEPSKHKLTWPNGATAHTFSAEEPDRLRGHQFNWAWLDEPAHTPFIKPVWDNLLLCLRLPGKYPPRVCATTTPTPIPWLRELIASPDTVVTRVSTYSNLSNLSETFAKQVLARYEGTRLGRQELHGELLEDVEGALWGSEMIQRAAVPDQLDRIVVGIDPAGGARPSNDETGIVVVGVAGSELYVLADRSGRYSPAQWAAIALHLVEEFSADAVVAERNYGGEMVRHTLRSVEASARVTTVHSRRGKALRAEPISSLYEQRKAFHCGMFDDLEAQMLSWVPGVTKSSPDRVDALVHAATALMRRGGMASIASPLRLVRSVP